jgi:hypothetical protein
MSSKHPIGIKLKLEGNRVNKFGVYHFGRKIGSIHLRTNGVESEWKIVGYDSQTFKSKLDAIEGLMKLFQMQIKYS